MDGQGSWTKRTRISLESFGIKAFCIIFTALCGLCARRKKVPDSEKNSDVSRLPVLSLGDLRFPFSYCAGKKKFIMSDQTVAEMRRLQKKRT